MAEAQPAADNADQPEDKWAGWKGKDKDQKEKEKDAKTQEVNQNTLLLSEQVQDLFEHLSVKERTARYKDKTNTHGGLLDLDERAFLSMLLADVAGFKDTTLAKPSIDHAMCCAEFYAEMFPSKVHRRVGDLALRELLTLAVRRSALVAQVREDPRLATFAHKIPLNSNDNPISADPFTIKEIFWIIIAVCINEDARKQILRARRRNLIILTISVCRQGNFTRSIVEEKLRYIHEEYKLPDLGTKLESLEQFWKLYCKHVIVPPFHIPMLDYNDARGGKNEKKTEETAQKEEEETKQESKSDEVDELTQLLEDVKITPGKNTWLSFFKRLTRRCRASRTLQFFIKQIHTGGHNTVTYQFRQAYENFPDFEWMLAFTEFPEEQKKLWKALEDLAADPFFDFKKLHKVPFRDFLHLGYLGIKLQEKAGGVHSLAGFKGFNKFEVHMKYKYKIDAWVRQYCVSWGIDPFSAMEYSRNDPTLKYANVNVPRGSGGGGGGKYSILGAPVRGDPTLKYANFHIPGGKGTKHYYDEGYSGDYGYEYEDYSAGWYGGGNENYGRGDQNYEYWRGDSYEYRSDRDNYEYGRKLAQAASRVRPVEYQGGYHEYGDAGVDKYGPYGYQSSGTGEHSLEYYRGLRDGFLSATLGSVGGAGPARPGGQGGNKPNKGRGRGRPKNTDK